MRQVVVIGQAANDLTKAQRFYNKQQRGLGDRFYDALQADLRKLQSIAGVHTSRFACQRLIAEEFPFGIFYRIDGDLIVVIAIFDLRRDPAAMARALNRRT